MSTHLARCPAPSLHLARCPAPSLHLVRCGLPCVGILLEARGIEGCPCGSYGGNPIITEFLEGTPNGRHCLVYHAPGDDWNFYLATGVCLVKTTAYWDSECQDEIGSATYGIWWGAWVHHEGGVLVKAGFGGSYDSSSGVCVFWAEGIGWNLWRPNTVSCSSGALVLGRFGDVYLRDMR